MSGFKNFFRKNSNAIRNEPGNKNTNRRHSSCNDGEDVYEAVDPDEEDNSSSFSPEPETSVWSENEFDDAEEDIYLNGTEFAPATAKTEDIEKSSLPPLPPRTRGPTQSNYPTIVLPSTNQQNHQRPPPVPDYKRFKQQVGKEDSVDSTESYEEFNETSVRDKLKIVPINKPTTVDEEESSGSEDYESINFPTDSQKFDQNCNNEKVHPLGSHGKALEATPAVGPSLPPRSNRPCPPVPLEISEGIYESVESEPSAPSKSEQAIFSKLTSALRAKNLTKQSNKPEVIKPEIPVGGDVTANDEIYEITDESPISDMKLSISDCFKSRKLPPIPGQMVIPDETIKPPPRVSPTPRKNLPPLPSPRPKSPDSEQECNSGSNDEATPQPPSFSKKPTTNKSKPPNNNQKEFPKPVEEDSKLKIQQRAVPYTHVTLKDKDTESSLPLPLGRKPLKPHQTEINKPPPDSRQPLFSKSPSFLQKQMTAKNTPPANNSAADVEAERIVENEINKPVKNNYWKHTPPKIQVHIPASADTISSENPAKTNYPRHVPLKPHFNKVGQNQDGVTNANEENPILADAMNKLKNLKGITAKLEQDESKTVERKFQGLKQTIQGTASKADVSPYYKEQRCNKSPSVPDSKSQKDHGKETPISDAKVLVKSDAKSHISDLMDKFEKKGPFANVGSPNSSTDNKPDLKSSSVFPKNNNPPGKYNSFEKKIGEKGFKVVQGPDNESQLPTCRNKYRSEERLRKEEPIKQKSIEETKAEERNLKHSNTLPKPVVSSRSPIVPLKQKTVTPRDSLEDCSWYLPDVSRPDAEKKLRSIGKDGAFLVRKSQRGDTLTPYSLSLLHSGRIYNLHVRKRSDNKYAIGSEKKEEQSFSDLTEMVSYHATIPIEIIGVGSKVYLLHSAQK